VCACTAPENRPAGRVYVPERSEYQSTCCHYLAGLHTDKCHTAVKWQGSGSGKFGLYSEMAGEVRY